jgi:hypothetical protein
MFAFAALWAVGLVTLFRGPDGWGMNAAVAYFVLLFAAYVVFCVVKLLFASNRR